MRIPDEGAATIGREWIALTPEIVAAVMNTLRAGWAEAVLRPEVNPAAGEVVMTECLRDGMRSVLKSGRLPFGKALIVAGGMESRSVPTRLVPDGRTDIPLYVIEIFFRYEEHDPHAIVECKRLAGGDAHLCREYVVEGIDRFQTGKYAENHAVGFMAGYVLDSDTRSAIAGINACLRRARRVAESLAPSSLVVRPEFWESAHGRSPPRGNVALHHALLEV